jgi:hypothetical protein
VGAAAETTFWRVDLRWSTKLTLVPVQWQHVCCGPQVSVHLVGILIDVMHLAMPQVRK